MRKTVLRFDLPVQDGMYPLQEDDPRESGCEEDEEEEETREEEEFDSDESLVDSDSDSDEKGALRCVFTRPVSPFHSHWPCNLWLLISQSAYRPILRIWRVRSRSSRDSSMSWRTASGGSWRWRASMRRNWFCSRTRSETHSWRETACCTTSVSVCQLHICLWRNRFRCLWCISGIFTRQKYINKCFKGLVNP